MNRTKILQSLVGLAIIGLILASCGAGKPDPEAAQKYHDQGVLNFMTAGGGRDPGKAVENFSKAIKADPSFVKSYNARGVAYVLLEDYDKARMDFEKALEIDPSYKMAQENLDHLDAGEYTLATAFEF